MMTKATFPKVAQKSQIDSLICIYILAQPFSKVAL
jgi:hypothetical protein